MKKVYLILILLMIPFVFANEEVQITCGGNEEVQINCLGNEELSFWGSLPTTASITGGSGGGNIIKTNKTVPPTIFGKVYNYSYLFIILGLIIFFILLFYIIYKRKNRK